MKKAIVIFNKDNYVMSIPKAIELYSTGRRNKRKRGEVSEEGGQPTTDFCYDTQRGLVLTLYLRFASKFSFLTSQTAQIEDFHHRVGALVSTICENAIVLANRANSYTPLYSSC